MKMTGQFVVVCWLVFLVFWAVSALSTKPTKERQPLASRLGMLAVIVLSILFINGTFRRLQLHGYVLPDTLVVGVFGDLVVLIGLTITLWARIVLGSNWSGRITFKEGHELIQHGPYRFVRHPIYSVCYS